MDLYRLSVFAHIFFSVVFTGLALYWIIMLTSLNRRFNAVEAGRMLEIAHGARWPHVAVPYRWRVPLPWITWLVVLALWGTGVANSSLKEMPEGALWWIKLGLFVAIITTQAALIHSPRPKLVRLNFALVVAMILVSGWVIRGEP